MISVMMGVLFNISLTRIETCAGVFDGNVQLRRVENFHVFPRSSGADKIRVGRRLGHVPSIATLIHVLRRWDHLLR